MSKGYVRIPNRLFQTKWWNKKRVFSESDAIIDLYQSADRKNMVNTSIRSLADRWIWEPTRVLRFLQKLESDGYLNVTKTSTGTTVTICDFGLSATPTATPSATPSATPKPRCTKGFQEVDATPSATPSETPSATPRAYKNDNIISCLKEEEKNNNPSLSPQGESDYDWQLLDKELWPAALEWLQYKRERKQTYKPSGFKMFCKKLVEYSGGDAEKAQKIVEQSMASNWSGIFELKDYGTANRTTNNNDHPSDNQLREQSVRLMQRLADERHAYQAALRQREGLSEKSEP